MSDDGIRVFPRILPRVEQPAVPGKRERASTGIAALDAMMDGGIPAGESALIVGPSGSGKSLFARHFIAAGAVAKERGIIAVFEEHPGEYLARAEAFGPALAAFIESGLIEVLYLRSLDLTVDETLAAIRDAVARTGAKRVAIDSLSGFELALAPSFREDFRESLYRMVGGLVGLGVTVIMTAELVESYVELRLSPHGISFLTDGIILQRYAEIDGGLRKVMCVVKMRGFDHDKQMRQYEIGPAGIVIGDALAGYEGILVGAPRRIASSDATRR
jgi:circadian clock protein KaiC